MRRPSLSTSTALIAIIASAAILAPTRARAYEEAIACRLSETNITLDLLLPLARDGSGNAARGMRGTLDIHHQKMAHDRRHWQLSDKLPAQFWNWGKDMKLRLLLGTGDQLLDLVIDTQQRQGYSIHSGTYKLETSEGVRVTGRIECLVG